MFSCQAQKRNYMMKIVVDLMMMNIIVNQMTILAAKYLEINMIVTLLKNAKNKFIVVFVLENTPNSIAQTNNLVALNNSTT